MKKTIITLSFLILLAGLHWSFQKFLNPYILQIIILIGINLILSASLNLINGYTGQFSLGHAGFMAVGAYASAAFSVYAHPTLELWLHFLPYSAIHPLLFLLSLLLGSLAGAFAGLMIGLPTLRLRGDYLAIATLGFGEIILVVFNNMKSVGGATGFKDIPEYSNFFWIALFAALTMWVVRQMTRSSKGMEFSAIREDEIAALSLGISNTRVKVKAFVIGAFFAGLGGGLFAHFLSYLHINMFSFIKSIELVVMVVLGGMGNLWGVAIATALLTALPELLRGFAEWRMVLYSLLIIFTMLLRSKKFSLSKLFSKRKLEA